MTIQPRNNNKAPPNVFVHIQLAGGGLSDNQYYCNNCKVFYNHASTGGSSFKTHLVDVHGFVDSG